MCIFCLKAKTPALGRCFSLGRAWRLAPGGSRFPGLVSNRIHQRTFQDSKNPPKGPKWFFYTLGGVDWGGFKVQVAS